MCVCVYHVLNLKSPEMGSLLILCYHFANIIEVAYHNDK